MTHQPNDQRRGGGFYPDIDPQSPAQPMSAIDPKRTSLLILMAFGHSGGQRLGLSLFALPYESCVDPAGRKAALAIAKKSAATSEAPPTSTPSTSGCAKRLPAFSGFTLPP